MKIRRVGNSNVISLPRELEELGYTVGTPVVVEELPSGELRVVPVTRLREFIRAASRHVAAKDREALQILADYDRGKTPRK